MIDLTEQKQAAINHIANIMIETISELEMELDPEDSIYMTQAVNDVRDFLLGKGSEEDLDLDAINDFLHITCRVMEQECSHGGDELNCIIIGTAFTQAIFTPLTAVCLPHIVMRDDSESEPDTKKRVLH